MSFYQSIVIFTIVFGAYKFFPEGAEGPHSKPPCDTQCKNTMADADGFKCLALFAKQAEATDKALKTSEKLSYSCVSAFERNGVDIPERCFPQKDQTESDAGSRQYSWLTAQFDTNEDGSDGNETKKDRNEESFINDEGDGLLGNLGGVIGGVGGDRGDHNERRTVACLRKCKKNSMKVSML